MGQQHNGHSGHAGHTGQSILVQPGSAQITHAAAVLPQLVPAEASMEAVLDPIAQQRIATLEDEAKRRIAAAEAAAAARIEAAQAEAERWRQHALSTEADAQQRGFAAGYAEGERQGRQAGESAVHQAAQADLDRLAHLVAGADANLQAALRAAQAQLAALSVAIARTIALAAFQLDDHLLARRIAALLEHISQTVATTVRVSPADLPLLQPQWPDLVRAQGWLAPGPRLIADEAITPGGCIIETGTQYLDARLETLCARVAETFAQTDEAAPEVTAA
jgi:flagellar assembly protein FliH